LIDDFERKLEKYAEVAVHIGNNLQPGQRLLIIGRWLNRGVPLELTPLVQKITEVAYKAGAPFVDVIWADQKIDLLRHQYAPRDSFEEYPKWFLSALLEYLERGDALMVIFAENPELFKDQDQELVALATKTAIANYEPGLKYVTGNIVNWAGLSAPIKDWADLVLPDFPEEQRLDRMWEAIFKICRIDREDPIAAWKEHLAGLGERCAFLNEKRYSALRYKGPGTDLTVGLAPNHRWQSGGMTNTAGVTYTANIPTEEIFCLPDKRRAEGVVSASMPLSYGGNLIEGFQLTFREGRVVDVDVQKGETALKGILDMDEGARHLGEVALVPHSSPISQLGWLFYNTLFDENAASHIALGRGIRACLDGGPEMSAEDFDAAGGNYSKVHVDFMIGSEKLDIDGLSEDGSSETVMRGGDWVF
jgi:aminopeptidase